MYEEIDNFLQNNEWDKAISLIQTEKDFSTSKELLQRLGLAYSRIENYNEAIVCFNKLIEVEPQMAKWYYMKGYQFYMQSKWNEAIVEFLKALELYPKYLVVRYRLAYAYLQITGTYLQYTKDTFWKALGQLKECHTIYKDYSKEMQEREKHTYFDICFLHGKTIQEMNNKQEEAVDLLNTALSLKQDEDCQYQLAKTYFIMKKYDKALAMMPHHNKYYVKELEANIYAELGKFKESNSILLKLVKYRKKDYIYCKLAENHIQEDKIDGAIEFTRQAINYGKDNYKNYLLLGKLLYKKEQYKSAVDTLTKASRIKMQKFQLSCPEADKLISEILETTNNNPYDLQFDKKESIIVDYNPQKCFGFIDDKEYGKVFIHISNVKNANSKDLKGKKVLYNVEKTDKGYCALNVNIKED